jgi:hypothetical protein
MVSSSLASSTFTCSVLLFEAWSLQGQTTYSSNLEGHPSPLTSCYWFSVVVVVTSSTTVLPIGNAFRFTVTYTVRQSKHLETSAAVVFMWQAFSNSMRGTISSELGLLIKLNYLSLGQNLLTGTIPNELGLLTNLDWLALNTNYLTGAVRTSLASLPVLSTSTLAVFFLYYFGTIALTCVRMYITGMLYTDHNDLKSRGLLRYQLWPFCCKQLWWRNNNL